MHEAEMLLHPVDPQLRDINREALIEEMHAWAFIGGRDGAGPGRWLVGEAFPRLVMFLGCSPQLKTQPAEEDRLEVALFSAPDERPHFFHAENTVAPACPGCGERYDDFGFKAAGTGSLHCPACGETHPTQAWRWQLTAAYASFAIRVFGIYPHEALPGDELLWRLQALTGAAWHYAYLLRP